MFQISRAYQNLLSTLYVFVGGFHSFGLSVKGVIHESSDHMSRLFG